MMVKFSAEEGQKRKRRCLPSSSRSLSDSGEEDGDAGEEGEADAATTGDCGSSEHSSGGGDGSSNGGKESVTVIIDLDVLECPICYEIMDPPIFQVGGTPPPPSLRRPSPTSLHGTLLALHPLNSPPHMSEQSRILLIFLYHWLLFWLVAAGSRKIARIELLFLDHIMAKFLGS